MDITTLLAPQTANGTPAAGRPAAGHDGDFARALRNAGDSAARPDTPPGRPTSPANGADTAANGRHRLLAALSTADLLAPPKQPGPHTDTAPADGDTADAAQQAAPALPATPLLATPAPAARTGGDALAAGTAAATALPALAAAGKAIEAGHGRATGTAGDGQRRPAASAAATPTAAGLAPARLTLASMAPLSTPLSASPSTALSSPASPLAFSPAPAPLSTPGFLLSGAPLARGDAASDGLPSPAGWHTGAATALVPPPAAGAALPSALHAPLGSAPWPQELSQHLLRLVRHGDQQVQLHLNPRELGPLQISLRVDDQSAQAHFFSAHSQVRDAVHNALPQLRDALAGQGIALSDTHVGQQQQQPQQHQQPAPHTAATHLTGTPREPTATATATATALPLPQGQVDTYA